MMTAAFGRELAEVHLQEALKQAENSRLIGCLKRQRRQAAARAKAATPCPKDFG